jgi:predicted ATPase
MDDAVRTLLRGRYEPIRVLGRGGQGEVVLARDHQHGHDVAIKIRAVSSDREREEVLSEARVLLRVRPHPNIALVRDDFFVDDHYYVVMDHVEGRSLAYELAARGAPGLPVADVVAWLTQVAAGIDHLHAEGALHLDVKPANILVSDDGRAVLVDFGVASLGERTYGGTHGYQAPELGHGERPGRAADIYSLGATAFALLTGTPPEPGGADWSGIAEVDRARIIDAIGWSLAGDPMARPPSAMATVSAISAPDVPNTLPASASRFIGRERSVVELVDEIASTRLLTLTGPGGSGKTRLAIEVARRLLARYPEGVWFVELAVLADSELVPDTFVRALGATDQPGRSAKDILKAAFAGGPALLVVDNCEHLIDACAALVEDLLHSCPDLSVIATSREPLRVDGETIWPVAPLDVPDGSQPVDTLRANESVRLFCQRAASAHRGFVLDDTSMADVASICRSADGVPLAIELAAMQLRTSHVGEIAESLRTSIAALVGGRRTVPRHETIRAAIDQSYERLDPDAQRIFRTLSVFAGGATAEAVRDVAGDESAPALLEQLADRSIINRSGGASTRYRVLEPLRLYAAERLAEADETASVERAHSRAFMRLLEDADLEGEKEDQAGWLTRLDEEHDNIRTALGRALRLTDAEEALRLAALMTHFWSVRGHHTEGSLWLSRAIAMPGGTDRTRSRALVASGRLSFIRGAIAAARSSFEESLAFLHGPTSEAERAGVLNNLGALASQRGEVDAARAYFEEALGYWRRLDDERHLASTLTNLGTVVMGAGDLESARRYFEEAVTRIARLGDSYVLARLQNNLAMIARFEGDLDEAERLLTASLDLKRELEDQPGIFATTNNLAHLARSKGDLHTAKHRHLDALELASELANEHFIAEALDGLAIVTVSTDAATSAKLLGAVDALRSRLSMPVMEADVAELGAAEAEARNALGDARFEQTFQAGRTAEVAGIVSEALAG